MAVEVCVRVPHALRELVSGERAVIVRAEPDADGGVTVAAVLDALATRHPALERRVRDEQGRVREHVNLFVGAENIRDLDGLGTGLTGAEELSIIPAISGG